MAQTQFRNIIYIPTLADGKGSGHFRRAVGFASESPSCKTILLLNPHWLHKAENYLDAMQIHTDSFSITIDQFLINTADLLILDLFDIYDGEFRELFSGLNRDIPIILVDDGGQFRRFAPYVLDMLPNLNHEPANKVLPGLLWNSSHPAGQGNNGHNFLITFGGEDPASLTNRVAAKMSAVINSLSIPGKLTVISPVGKQQLQTHAENQDLIEQLPNLRSKLGEYTGIVTSFGITALEAAAQRLPVLLVNPTDYHQKVARKAGFSHTFVKMPSQDVLEHFFRSPQEFIPRLRLDLTPVSFVSFIDNLGFLGFSTCPVCSQNGRIIYRNSERSYFRCTICNLIFASIWKKERIGYNQDYFFEQYRNQYGKTYLDDFDSIKKTGQSRINRITGLRSCTDTSLLDIGCAYGPFLQAASEAGYKPAGVDVSKAALEYVQTRLGFSAWTPDEAPHRKWSVITMWYVIEHLENLNQMLKDVYANLLPGGVFAFSTPNANGISGRKNKSLFLANGPADHITVWEPRSAKKVLKKLGFRHIRIKITGHHPERFPLSWFKAGIGFKLGLVLSKVLKMGDTFEVYAKKNK